MAREEAAREVAGGVRQHRHDQDPVEGRGAVEEVVLERLPEEERDDREEDPQPELDGGGHAEVLAAADAAHVAVRDRA